MGDYSLMPIKTDKIKTWFCNYDSILFLDFLEIGIDITAY